jgi:hypothetical protein
MAHAQKPDFVFRRNGRIHLNRRGRQFSRILAAEVCASAVVMLDAPCSELVWRVLATHSIRQFPLHFPSRASPCAITFQLDSTSEDDGLDVSALGGSNVKTYFLLVVKNVMYTDSKQVWCHWHFPAPKMYLPLRDLCLKIRVHKIPQKYLHPSTMCGPGSSVGIATGYGLGGPGIGGVRFSARPDWSWGPLCLLYIGYRVFPEGKARLGRAVDHSPPSNAAVKKG